MKYSVLGKSMSKVSEMGCGLTALNDSERLRVLGREKG